MSPSKVHLHDSSTCPRQMHILSSSRAKHLLTLTYCPSCHRQLEQQQILLTSGGLEPVFVRFSMNVPWLSHQPQQYVSMSSLDARVFCVPLVSIRLLLLGWSLDLCVILWPIHLQRLRAIVVSILSCWHSLKRS